MKLAIVSLGCPKNQVDADVFCHALLADGHETVADPAEADAIEAAVSGVLDAGLRTADIMQEGCTPVGCAAMGDAILARL